MANTRHRATTHHCPACETRSFTRNNYFTGKLLVERDFNDEQRYYMEKMRLHHQRLHGMGVVCGLRVTQHEREACRDRYVVLQPGSAIDCCGHDILVAEPETIDLEAFPAVRALRENSDDEKHTLQVCICYRECPTEEIPVLYDECGCEDSRCAPNRILESYSIEVRVDPPEQPTRSPRDWQHPLRTVECPNCDAGDCIVVATITNYRPGHTLLELSETTRDSGVDTADDVAWIDNDIDRMWLPSTQKIAETLAGRDLTHITGINWEHAGRNVQLSPFLTSGLRVLFDKKIDPRTLHEHSVRVLIPRDDLETGAVCWYQVKGSISAMHFDHFPDKYKVVSGENKEVIVNGLQFIPDPLISPPKKVPIRVLINGDFIRDANGCGVDADHLPPWLPTRPTGNGVEGGLFESWFELAGRRGPINIGTAERSELETLFPTPVAERILENRPTSVDELLHIPGVDAALIERIRDRITFN